MVREGVNALSNLFIARYLWLVNFTLSRTGFTTTFTRQQRHRILTIFIGTECLTAKLYLYIQRAAVKRERLNKVTNNIIHQCVTVLTWSDFIVAFSRYPDSRLMNGSYIVCEKHCLTLLHTVVCVCTLLSAMEVCFLISSTMSLLPISSASSRAVCPFYRTTNIRNTHQQLCK